MAAYTNAARYYDTIYSFKDYRIEADAIRALIAQHQTYQSVTLLDVGCGTGAHLKELQSDYQCEGIELSPDMLEIAREKLPGMPLHEGDMRTFDLGKTFDVVLCLFSAIGYMLTESDLNAAVANMTRHVSIGGLLIVESWLHPEQFTPGHISMLTIDRPEVKIARMNRSEVHGHISWMPMHHLITTTDRIDHFVELHELGLYESEVYERAFTSAGLATIVDSSHTLWRTLYIGTRP